MAEGSDMSTIQPTQSALSSGQSKPVEACENTTPIHRYSCWIVDMCHLSDGTILLIDSTDNKLKRLYENDNRYYVKDFLEFNSEPRGVCPVSSSEVAVRLNNNTIQFISVNESSTVTRQVSINHPIPCRHGLARCSDQFWVPGDGGVYVYSLSDGSLLKKITTDSQDRALFPENPPQRIAVSNDGSMVYVTAGDDRVAVFNKNGDYIREIRDKRLDVTCCICITCDDIVLVSSFEYSNVLMFDMKGVFLGELLSRSDMFAYPRSMCFDRKKCRLFVSNFNLYNNRDTIDVFDLG